MLLQTQDEDCRTNPPQMADLYKRAASQVSEALIQPPKNAVGEQHTFENNVLFSDNLLPFPPLTARTGNSANAVYLLKSPSQSGLFPHHSLPIGPSLLKTPFCLCPDPLCKLRDTLYPHYLKHPHFPPRHTACAAFEDIRYL